MAEVIKKKYILLTLGVALFTFLFILIRIFIFDLLGSKPDKKVWKVDLKVRFITTDRRGSIIMPVLRQYRHAKIISEKIIRPGLTLRRRAIQTPEGSRIKLTANRPGIYTIYTEDMVTVRDEGGGTDKIPENMNDPVISRKYLEGDKDIPVHSREIERELSAIPGGDIKAEGSIEGIYKYVYRKYNVKNGRLGPEYTMRQLYNIKALKKANKFISLVRSIDIPARRVVGLILNRSNNALIHTWAEVYVMNEWVPFDPYYGYAFRIPSGYIRYQYGGKPLFHLNSARVLDLKLRISEGSLGFYRYARKIEKFIDVFNLNRLTFDTRKALVYLLLLPFGALFTAFCRIIIGVRSYGTFTPTLIAMTVLYADWGSVLMVLLVIGTVSVLGRSVFPEKINRVPRLSIILTIIALTMVFTVSVVDFFSVNINGDVFLLPIIIITSLVDRFYTAVDDSGIRPALYMLGWTILISAGCYGIMQIEMLGVFILNFPESHLITIAIIYLMEKYTGKKIISYTPLYKYSGITAKVESGERQLEFNFLK